MEAIDKNTILTTIFTIVDDALKVPKLQLLLHRFFGPKPDMSDSEVITVALFVRLNSS